MKRNFSSLQVSFMLTLALVFLFLTPTQAQDVPKGKGTGQAIYETTKNAANEAGFPTGITPGGQELPTVIGLVIRGALLIIGSVFLAFMIYGGYLWLTARGNTDQVNKAKELIINASIGILIVTSAYVITYFIVAKIGAATQYKGFPANL